MERYRQSEFIFFLYLGDASHKSKSSCSIAYSVQVNFPIEAVSTEHHLIKDSLDHRQQEQTRPCHLN